MSVRSVYVHDLDDLGFTVSVGGYVLFQCAFVGLVFWIGILVCLCLVPGSPCRLVLGSGIAS
jgi:hypothetical protein